MHIHFEKSINAKSDCSILSMSWMGKVPDELPEEEGWKLNRTHYYQEGWLATGNLRGIVGVTFTSSQWRRNLSIYGNGNNANGGTGGQPSVASFCADLPQRTNYNLRGHRSQITLVQWNEPYQKLASCDSSGIIFVWIKFEGRWSIELINDRSTPVTHFSWSHDGRMALICYKDGFVLVGSVAGQRYWSSMLNLNAIITCGLWAPDDQQVYLGTSSAQVIVMDVIHGMMISQVQIPMDCPILSMSWSCEKFKMEENEEVIAGQNGVIHAEASSSASSSPGNVSNIHDQQAQLPKPRPMVLAVIFQNGLVFLMKNYDDIAPIQIYTGFQQGLMMEWSNSGEYLAVVGSRPVEIIGENGAKVHEYFNSLHFYNHNGVRILSVVIPSTQSPVTALTWGHNDKRIFIAIGQTIHVGWVAKRIASLQLLCRLTIYKALSDETCVSHLPLPLPVRTLISSLHTQTILSILPNEKDLLEFVSHPPYNNVRLHCTMIRHDEIWSQSPGTVYTLYLEYLGGLIPILKGKRISKIRPHFVIYSPQRTADSSFAIIARNDQGPTKLPTPFQPRRHIHEYNNSYQPHQLLFSDSSDSDDVELCASPRLQRKRHRARLRERQRERQLERELEWERSRNSVEQQNQGNNNGQPLTASTMNLNNLEHFIHPLQPSLSQQLAYNDVLPEETRLVEVTSNLWGTKFKIHGLESFPPNLGSLSYKTSVLHLQPRQMTCVITELTDDIFVNSASSTTNASADNSNQQHHTNSSSLDEADDMFSIIVGSGNASNCAGNNANYYTPPTIPPSSTFERTISNSIHKECRQQPRAVHTTTTGTSFKDDDYVEIQPLLAELNMSDTPAKRHLVTHSALIERIDEPSSASTTPTPGPSSLLSHRGSVHSSPSKSRRVSWTKLQHPPMTMVVGSCEPGSSKVLGDLSNSSPPPPPVQPIHVRRSISASFLDNVFERTLPVPVDMVSPDMIANPLNSPPKRLVLIKENQIKECNEEDGTEEKASPPLKQQGKSKSWDFADLVQLKQQRHLATPRHVENKRNCCPNCNFPAAVNKSNVTDYATILKTSAGLGNKFPKTPARKTSIPKATVVVIPRRKDSNEDRIERLAESPPPPLESTLPIAVPPVSNMNLLPQTPKLQRRLSNFLTPILRRKEFFSSSPKEKRKQSIGNPNSTCYIPPESPTHIAKRKPMSTPTTPAAKRKFKTGNLMKQQNQSLAAGCSSPFRQFFANSPLLSRRKYNNSTSTKTNSSSTSSSSSVYRHNQYQPSRVIDSTDDDEDDDYEIEVPSSPSLFCRSRSNSMKASMHHLAAPTSMTTPATQAHHRGTTAATFRDLESFQKNQLRQKLRKKKIHNIDNSPMRPKRREFVLHNKAPMWNENSQVYQLDFGGRVTQESAKNFQIEFRGKQVMQFGRIDGNAYTLDFQYPFSALQAFGVALANITQRLK